MFCRLSHCCSFTEPTCNCSNGSEGISDPEDCDPSTGQCSCLSVDTGLQCEDCEEGFFTNGTSGCLACNCDSIGAVTHLCDRSDSPPPYRDVCFVNAAEGG